MSIVLMLNLKGGVAKTTNCVAVAEAMADSGHKILVIDADHQCMASELLIGEEKLLRCEVRKKTLHDMLGAMMDDEFTEANIPPYIVEQVSNIGGGYPNLHLLPCSIRIDEFQTNMAKARRGFNTVDEYRQELQRKRGVLQRFLKNNYDCVLIDCPPSLAMQVVEFLLIGDAFIIPSVPDRLSVRGSIWLLERLRRRNISRIQPLGTLWSLYRTQAAIHNHIIDQAEKGIEPLDILPRPFRTIIPNAARIAESTEPDRHPHTFSSKYSPFFAQRYKHLAREVRTRLTRMGV